MVVLHERYGLVDNTRDVATRFAAHGHVAIAPNLFWREPDLEAIARAEARAEVPDTQVCEDISSALDYLQDVPGADLQRVAVSGYCQTGRHPLVYAASDLGAQRVSTCVVFHGAAYPREWVLNAEKVIPYDELIARSKVPVFGAFGEKDQLISLPDVLRFRASLEAAQRSYQIRVFPDAPHSWLNHRIEAYREPQAESAWTALFAFLDRVYGGGFPSDRVQWEFSSDTGRAEG
jgi:carboxymethylenebutenolidase